MRGVHVAHFEARAFAVEAAGAERADAADVVQLRERVSLVHDLREFAAAEEFLEDGGQRARAGNFARRGHLASAFAGNEAVADGPAPADARFADGQFEQFVNRLEDAVAQVVNVVGTGALLLLAQPDEVADGAENILPAKRQPVEGDAVLELLVDAEASDTAEAVVDAFGETPCE